MKRKEFIGLLVNKMNIIARTRSCPSKEDFFDLIIKEAETLGMMPPCLNCEVDLCDYHDSHDNEWSEEND